MKRNFYLPIFLLTAMFIFSACGGNRGTSPVIDENRPQGTAPFILPPQEDFVLNRGIQAFSDNYTIEVITYEMTSNDNVENQPSIILLFDIYGASLGLGGFFGFDRIHMLSEGYVLAIENWLLAQGRKQAEALNVTRTTRDDSFIIIVVGVDDVAIGSSIFDSETRSVIWTAH